MYSYKLLKNLFAQLLALHPKLQSVSNDVLPPIADSQNYNQRKKRHHMHLVKHLGVSQTIQFDSSPDKRIAELATFLACKEEKAAQTFEILKQIYEINSNGSWYIGPVQSEDNIILDASVSFPTKHSKDYITSLLVELTEILPVISEIKIDRYIEHTRNGSRRTKAMIRFMANEEMEVAAMDVQMMNLQLRHAVLPENNIYSSLNTSRERAYQKQLDIHPEDWTMLLHTLMLFTSTLPLKQIVLKTALAA